MTEKVIGTVNLLTLDSVKLFLTIKFNFHDNYSIPNRLQSHYNLQQHLII